MWRIPWRPATFSRLVYWQQLGRSERGGDPLLARRLLQGEGTNTGFLQAGADGDAAVTP